jgi:hypothetical protein
LTGQALATEDAEVNTLAADAFMSSAPSLLISLLFGVGQCAVGAILVRRSLRSGIRGGPSIVFAGLLGVWAICSGLAELLVSGFALVVQTRGASLSPTLAEVRRLADTALVLITVVLLGLVAAYSLARATRWGKTRSQPIREE